MEISRQNAIGEIQSRNANETFRIIRTENQNLRVIGIGVSDYESDGTKVIELLGVTSNMIVLL